MPARPALSCPLRSARNRIRGARRWLSLDTVNCVNFATAAAIAGLVAASPALARESLGMFGNWGAFRDPREPRCYAVAIAEPSQMRRDFQPFADVGTWPRKAIHGQVHVRLSRRTGPTARITLAIGAERFQLSGGGGDAWAADRRMDAAIVAAMRSARRMTVSSRDERGNPFANAYSLAGAPTAMDAATIGCAKLR